MPKGIKRTKEEIISALKIAFAGGADLRYSAIQEGKYRWIFRSHHHYFTSWKKALKAAGIKPSVFDERKKEEEKKKLLIDLKDAYEKGADLSVSALLQKGNPYMGLYYKAKKFFFGRFSWENALSAAGLPFDEIVKQKRWDKKEVKERLVSRKKEGKAMNASAISREEGGLYKAIINHFATFDEALLFAKMCPGKIRKARSYTNQDVILKIQELHAQEANLSRSAILSEQDEITRRYVYFADRSFEDGWRGAVTEAGFDYSEYAERKERGFWNDTEVITGISELKNKGESLSPGDVAINYSGLYHVAERYAGGWKNALRLSGIDPEDVMKNAVSLSKEEIISKVKDLHASGQDLSCTGIMNSPELEIRRLFHQGCNRFGSWEKTVEAAGLDYGEIRRKRGQYTLEELSEKILNLERNGVNLSLSSAMADKDIARIHRAVIRRFDSWEDFLTKIGIDAKKYCTQTDWKNGKEVIEYLKTKFDSGVVTGATRDRNFSAAVNRYFKTLVEAVETAELMYCKSGKITKKMLEDSRNVEILYRCNTDFFKMIAKKVFWGAKSHNFRSLNVEDLVNEAFIKFLEILPNKPVKKGVRQFAYWPIYTYLVQTNKGLFSDVLFEKEVYFDLFGKKEGQGDEDEDNPSYEDEDLFEVE